MNKKAADKCKSFTGGTYLQAQTQLKAEKKSCLLQGQNIVTMSERATYRVTTAEHELSHAYITDRCHLEKQVDINSKWGQMRLIFSDRKKMAALTALGDSLSEEGKKILEVLWDNEVLNSTSELKKICPFIFLSFFMAAG